MRMKDLRNGLVAAAIALMTAEMGTALAQAVISTGQSFVAARMLAGAQQEGGARLAGLRLTLSDGWKTYWRSPGEAGIPPDFDWSESSNVASVEVYWPRPEVFTSFGLRTIGYSGQIVFPLRVTPVDPASPVDLALNVRLGVCRDICIIEDISMSERIEPGQRPIGIDQIERAMSRVPQPASDVGLVEAACRISGTGTDRVFEARLAFDRAVVDPVVLVEGGEQFWVRKSTTRPMPDGVGVSAEIGVPKERVWVDRSAIRMTVLAEDVAADIRGCSAPRG